MDCSAFLNWDEDQDESYERKYVVFQSLVAAVKFQPPFDDSLEAKAVKFLESVDLERDEFTDAFNIDIVSYSHDSLSYFVQSIGVLISSASQAITAETMKMLNSLVSHCYSTIHLFLIEIDLIPQLISNLNPQSLSFAEAKYIHTCLISVIADSFWLSTPLGIAALMDEEGYGPQGEHKTIFQQVLVPSEKYIWHLCVNRFSIIDGEQSKYFLALLARLFQLCPSYQPTMDIVFNMPVFLTIPSCLTFFEFDESIDIFVYSLIIFEEEWDEEDKDVRQKWKTMLVMLRIEGIEDVFEEKLRTVKDTDLNERLVDKLIGLCNYQGMNLPRRRTIPILTPLSPHSRSSIPSQSLLPHPLVTSPKPLRTHCGLFKIGDGVGNAGLAWMCGILSTSPAVCTLWQNRMLAVSVRRLFALPCSPTWNVRSARMWMERATEVRNDEGHRAELPTHPHSIVSVDRHTRLTNKLMITLPTGLFTHDNLETSDSSFNSQGIAHLSTNTGRRRNLSCAHYEADPQIAVTLPQKSVGLDPHYPLRLSNEELISPTSKGGRWMQMEIIVRKSASGGQDEFERQSVLHNKFQHFNIVRHFPMSVDKNYHFVGMERLGGNLSTFLEETPTHPRPGLAAICSVLSGVVDGLSFLESKNQGYGALHPGNILIGRNNCGVLGDFFFTLPSLMKPQDIESGRCAYLAPELVGGPDAGVATNQSDVWSFGVIVMESVVGVNPFKGLSNTTLRTGVNSFDFEQFVGSLNEEQKSRMTPALKRLLSECLQNTPTDRTTFSSIRRRHLLRSLLTTPDEIITFNEAIILHQHDLISQSIFAPSFGSETRTMDVIDGSSGEGSRSSRRQIPFHSQMLLKSALAFVATHPSQNIESVGTILVDGHVIGQDNTFAAAGVTSESVITVFPEVAPDSHIFIVLPGMRFFIMEYSEAHHGMNAGAFLQDCLDKLSRPIDKYTLHGEGGRLIALSKTMMENEIRAGSVITIRPIADSSEVFVKTLTGKMMSYEVELRTATVEDLKLQIHRKEGIPPDQQRLVFAGRQLADYVILSSVGIKPNSTIYFTPKLRGGEAEKLLDT
ncbi:putative Ubiquitin family protein [Blattamonas nauphoetae]|uniref:Ubiquitin family protein n=1 Tax=Blattamonas nauphoetae TaxID=2049346 RepID=A0ABQ9YJS7_9EUKA|nr:putative Ubiquitin family protein [Blattamonas nauphoetae]